jgi:nitrilase
MRLAALQLNSSADVQDNLVQAGEQLTRVAADGAQLVVLPENFALMSETRADRHALTEADGDGPLQAFLGAHARELGLWIVGGTLPIRSNDPERPFSACCVYNDSGERVARYDKIHLFDVQVPDAEKHDKNSIAEVYKESSFTSHGSEPCVVNTPWGNLGVAVCYDLRFPELFRQMLSSGFELLAVPAAFTVATGSAHWELLLRARAAENLSYVIAAAQVGVHPGGRHTWGHTMIVSPWGEVLADAGSEPGVVLADFDRAELSRLRQEFPVLQHKRTGQTDTE